MDRSGVSRPFISQNARQLILVHSIARKLWPWIRAHQKFSKTPTSDKSVTPMSVVCISDTHNSRPSLPDGDVILHAGDLSQYGTFNEVQDQLDWLNTQPHQHKIVIAGNHDLILDEAFVKNHPDRELNKPGKSYQDLR